MSNKLGLVKCESCGEGVLSLSGPEARTFYDKDEPDEKYWRLTYSIGHCWICGNTQMVEIPT
jgi:ribosomal protein S27E